MLTRTRKQGNSITLTVPKEFDIPTGVDVEAKLTETGIFYEFVEIKDNFFDFSEDLLSDIISEGVEPNQILAEFKKRKADLNHSINEIKSETLENGKVMTKEEMAAEIGL